MALHFLYNFLTFSFDSVLEIFVSHYIKPYFILFFFFFKKTLSYFVLSVVWFWERPLIKTSSTRSCNLVKLTVRDGTANTISWGPNS